VAAAVDLGAFMIIGTQTWNTLSLNAHIPPNEGYDSDMF
jgi:hypothetical protein